MEIIDVITARLLLIFPVPGILNFRKIHNAIDDEPREPHSVHGLLLSAFTDSGFGKTTSVQIC